MVQIILPEIKMALSYPLYPLYAIVFFVFVLVIWLHDRRPSGSSSTGYPPVVRILVPWIGHAIQYTTDPISFLDSCRYVYESPFYVSDSLMILAIYQASLRPSLQDLSWWLAYHGCLIYRHYRELIS